MQAKMNEQQRARLASLAKSFERRKKVGEHLSKIKHRIGVYSAKGGVGKTTVAVNLALALARRGARVGLLDADIDCPNADKVLGMSRRPEFRDGALYPGERAGVKLISTASFQEKEDEAQIWRGPIISNTLNQFLEMTEWGDLDYLIVDLPPGTSDSPLTVMQSLQMEGFIAVTTPQDLAMLDTKRSINMIKKMNIDVLGIVENMSGGVFGTGGGERIAKEMGIPFLGRLELAKEFGEMGEDVAVLKHEKVRKAYDKIIDVFEKELAKLPPPVVIPPQPGAPIQMTPKRE